ncbi:MAG TPA: glycosyl hydrolase family 28-related protein [Tepidisphaeraceae bacterium]|jgi:polygalacturonase
MTSKLLPALLCIGLTGCAARVAPQGKQTAPATQPSVSGEPTTAKAPGLHVLNVRDFGAKGDGQAIDTPAINEAIIAANAAGGGTVHFPAGTYLAASIRLKSKVTLYLEAGSVIEAADHRVAPADPPETRPEIQTRYQDFGHSYFQNSLIWGEKLHDVAILGPGLIHGKGLESGVNPYYDRAKGEREYTSMSKGAGNKAISLRECTNVTLRDFSILHGGWFAILATGINNLTIDNLKIDTNRDGIDIDVCRNVRITNTSVNSPWDDGICLKASFALGYAQACENITISDCLLAGNFIEGTLIDGTFKRPPPEYRSYRTGRIKFGTESNGDFKNITITNCVFDESRGIAIESVDGSHIEDVTISNIAMRNVPNSPIFLRLGSRLRGPGESTVVGSIKRVNISNVVASGVRRGLGSIIAGIPGHPVEDITFSNLHFIHEGGGTEEQANRIPPEREKDYPEPGMFGATPGYGLFVRHARNVVLNNISFEIAKPDHRAPFAFTDVTGVRVHASAWQKSIAGHSFHLRDVNDLRLFDCASLPDQTVEKAADERR